ncbi:unnamed protein product [Vitrella brassicaformis CCMP3155]|uniref:Uncharacterized protein n=2 Tax=Vitrella brassicaformis TaxID=1169539 RepID=A0A0G4GIY6_VITBC|nr:unnamed protein product [Vitrella brassicaformis CCMP3155]|eukprot:CEM29790.1 unnamed protein product [Vitrella brassicaformis CCMP3155]
MVMQEPLWEFDSFLRCVEALCDPEAEDTLAPSHGGVDDNNAEEEEEEREILINKAKAYVDKLNEMLQALERNALAGEEYPGELTEGIVNEYRGRVATVQQLLKQTFLTTSSLHQSHALPAAVDPTILEETIQRAQAHSLGTTASSPPQPQPPLDGMATTPSPPPAAAAAAEPTPAHTSHPAASAGATSAMPPGPPSPFRPPPQDDHASSSTSIRLRRRRDEGGGLGMGRVSREGEGDTEQMKDELVGLAEEMKGAAHRYRQVLQKDNLRLRDTAATQQRHLDRVQSENKRARKLRRSGDMSFLMAMLLLVIGAVVFCFMVMFIIVM